MKKIFLLFFLFLFSASVTFGQFVFGLKLGYNASKLKTSIDTIVSSYNSGLHFGAYFRIGGKLYFQPEIYYTFQGGTFENNVENTANNWKQKVTLGTLDIPALIGFRIINLKKVFNWRIMAGPMVSFVVNSKVKDMNSPLGPIENADINKVNWYVQAGTGFDVLFLTLDIRYQAGLNQMIKTAQLTADDGTLMGDPYNLNAINNMWVVSLGFKL
ncbi:MAG: porin family protein [Bacteroidetes bacterium]|nr:porin family protein [Bacteroidota bacterium]